MAASRHWTRRVEVKAPPEAWQRLGALLTVRRRTLGHTYRTTFEQERKVNRRLAADIESAAKDRVNTFTNGSLGLAAQGYAVTYESMLAVLRGEADALVPVPVVPVDPAAAGPPEGWEPPSGDPVRAASTWPYARPVFVRLFELDRQGIPAPSGAQMFGAGHPDAETWETEAAQKLDVLDRAYLIGEMRRNAAARARDPQGGTAGA